MTRPHKWKVNMCVFVYTLMLLGGLDSFLFSNAGRFSGYCHLIRELCDCSAVQFQDDAFPVNLHASDQ
eukprot:3185998-Amphidinium_carterae.1